MPRIGSSRDFLPQDEVELPEDGEIYEFRLVAVQEPKTSKSPFPDKETGEFKDREQIELEFVINSGEHEGFRLREWWTYSVYGGPPSPANLRIVLEALLGCSLDDDDMVTAKLSQIFDRSVGEDEEISIYEVLQGLAENQAKMRALLIHTERKRDGRMFAHVKADTAKKIKGHPTAPLSKKPRPAPEPEEDDDEAKAASLFDDGLGDVA
jgi:hypothetical protein